MQLLKELIFGRKFLFESNLSAEDFLLNLRNRTIPYLRKKDEDGSKPLIGKIKNEKVRLRRQLRIRKAFTPYFLGKLIKTAEGCRLEGRIRIDTLILLILGIWFFLFLSIALLFISYSGMDELVDLFMAFPLIFIFLILLMIVLMVRAEIETAQKDLENILQFRNEVHLKSEKNT